MLEDILFLTPTKPQRLYSGDKNNEDISTTDDNVYFVQTILRVQSLVRETLVFVNQPFAAKVVGTRLLSVAELM